MFISSARHRLLTTLNFCRTALRAGARDYSCSSLCVRRTFSSAQAVWMPLLFPSASRRSPFPPPLISYGARLRQAIHGGDPEQAQQAVRALPVLLWPIGSTYFNIHLRTLYGFASALAEQASANCRRTDSTGQAGQCCPVRRRTPLFVPEFVLEYLSLKIRTFEPALANYAQKAGGYLRPQRRRHELPTDRCGQAVSNEHFHEPLCPGSGKALPVHCLFFPGCLRRKSG